MKQTSCTIRPYSPDKDSLADIAQMFSEALYTDALFITLFPKEKQRDKYNPMIMEVYVKLAIKKGFIRLMEDSNHNIIGGATVMGPEEPYISAISLLLGMLNFRCLPLFIYLVFRKARFIIRLSDQVEPVHHTVKRNHLYVSLLGLLPEYRNRGLGARILSNIQEKAESSQVPVYLESSTEKNLSFYYRNGFEAFREIICSPEDLKVVFFIQGKKKGT